MDNGRLILTVLFVATMGYYFADFCVSVGVL